MIAPDLPVLAVATYLRGSWRVTDSDGCLIDGLPDELSADRDDHDSVIASLRAELADAGHTVSRVKVFAVSEEIVAYGPAETSPAEAPAGESAGEVAGSASPTPTILTKATDPLANLHRSTGSIAATLRQVAAAIEATGNREIPDVALSIGMQVARTSGATDAERIATVDLLCAALGTGGEYHEMQHHEPGTWWYQECDNSWQGVRIDAYAPHVTAPTGPAGTDGRTEGGAR